MDSIAKINKLLVERGMSGAELSRRIGVTRSIYSQWNARKYKPSNKSLKKIAEVLDVPVSEILPDEDLPENTASVPSQTSDIATEDQMKAAFWHGETVLDAEDIDELWEDVRAYVDLQTHLRRKKKIERNGTL